MPVPHCCPVGPDHELARGSRYAARVAEPPMSPNLTLKTQVWRFIVTGGFSAIVDFGLYVLLYKAVGL